MFRSVRVKLLAAIIGLLVVVAGAFGTLSYKLILGGIVKAQEHRLQQIASYEAAKINWMMTESASRLEQIARSEATERFASASAFYSLDRMFIDNADFFPVLSYIDESGFEELKFVRGKESSELVNLSSHPLIKRALGKPNEIQIQEMDDDFIKGKGIGFAYSVRNFFGEYGGTLLGIAPLSQFTGMLARQNIGETGYFLLVDDAGSVMIGSEVTASASGKNVGATPRLTASTGTRPPARLADEQIASAPLQDLPWLVNAVLPNAEFFADRSRLTVQLGVIAAAVLLLAGALAWAIGSAIMRPLKQLMGLTEAIGRGDFSRRAEIRSGDEFEHLGRAFDRMINQRSLAEENLKTARDMAEAGERVKSEFLATMSHEIRTPLNGVIGMSELLGRTPLSTQQREYLETITYSGHHLGNLINDVLDFSKIEAGEVEIKSENLDLRDLVDEVAVLLAVRAQEKKLDLCVELSPEVPTAVCGDAGRIRQILVNIVGNAVKFTDRGEIVVRITSQSSRNNSARFRFEVMDSGIGIEPGDHERVFESFHQSDDFQNRKRGGTGLGLAICRQLVEIMGGRIGVESEPGKGTRVWFELSLALKPGAGQPGLRVHPSIASLRVLVAESHPASARLVGGLLQVWGADCRFVTSAGRALEVLRQGAAAGAPYNLAILEHAAYGAGLPELCAEIVGDSRMCGLRLIVLFDYHDFTSVCGSMLPKSAVRLRKPVHMKHLHDAVVRALSAVGSHDDPGPPVVDMGPEPIRARVLVVEDNAVNQQVLIAMLELLGCEVDAVDNGRDGVDATLVGDYDAVLMDCQMPGMDGYEATRNIRRHERESSVVSRKTPVIALTANAMTGDREHCLAAGMCDYLSKPFTEDQLRAVLQEHVKSGERCAPGTYLGRRLGAVTAPLNENDDPVIDAEVIEKLRQLQVRTKRDVVGDTIRLFQESSMESMNALRAAVRCGDVTGIRNAAHNLKSSSYLVGARRLGDLCKRLEENARRNETASSEDLFDRVEPEYESVRSCLGNELAASG